MDIKDFLKAKEKINEQFKKGQLTKEQRSNALKKLREARSAARAGRLSKTPMGQFINYLTGSKPLSSIVDKKAATTAVKQVNIPAAQARLKASNKIRGAAKKKKPSTPMTTGNTVAGSNIPFRAKTKTKAKTHNIVKGDTLSRIAKDYGTTVATLKKLNNIKDVNKIYAGRSLKLPDSAKAPTKKSVPTPKSRPQLVTLKSGKKGTTAQRLKEIEAEKIHKKIKKMTGK